MKPILTLAICLLLSGCGNSPVTVSPEPTVEPGSFAITQVPFGSSVSPVELPVSAITGNREFNLGEIGNTSEFYFVLVNTGETNIVDVTLSVDHPGYRVHPASIPVLPPATEVALYQLVKITVIHGTPLSGIGLAPVLAPGAALSELRIEGTTTGADDESLDVGFTADLAAYALLADIRVTYGGGEVNLAAPSGSVFGGGYPGTVSTYMIPNNREITITNTGNVDLDLTVRGVRNPPQILNLGTFVLEPGQSETVIWPYSMLSHSDSFRFILNDVTTITDRRRLPIQSDGRVYVVLHGYPG